MNRKQLTIYLVSYLTVSFVVQVLLGIYMGYDWLERYTIIALSGIGFYAVLLLNTPKYLHEDCQKDVYVKTDYKEIDPNKAYIFNVKGAPSDYEFEHACRVLNRFYKNKSNIIVNGGVEVTEMKGKE